MRKVFCVLLLVCAGAGVVFAQEEANTGAAAASGSKLNAISMDTMPLFKGFVASGDGSVFFCMAFAYERQILSHFTVGAEIHLYPGQIENEIEIPHPYSYILTAYRGQTIKVKDDVPYFYFAMAANARFYPMSDYMEKFFVGANIGFNIQSLDSSAKSEDGGFAGMTAGLSAGYKLLMGKMFFLEPAMSYTYSKSGQWTFGGIPSSLGWQAGLRAGVTL